MTERGTEIGTENETEIGVIVVAGRLKPEARMYHGRPRSMIVKQLYQLLGMSGSPYGE